MGRPPSRRSSGRSTSEREGERTRARGSCVRSPCAFVRRTRSLRPMREGERERKESLKASCKERESPSPNASRNILTRPLSLPRPSNHLTTAPPSQFFPHCDIHYPSAVPYPAAAAASRRHGDVGGGSRSPRTTPQPGLRSRLDLQSERFPYSRKVPEREPISLLEYWGKKRSAQCSLRKVCMQCMRASSVIFRSVRC